MFQDTEQYRANYLKHGHTGVVTELIFNDSNMNELDIKI